LLTEPYVDPFLMGNNGGPNGAGEVEINHLEYINLLIDKVALGVNVISTLDNIPGLDLLPPGIGTAEDAGIDYFESVRDQNNRQIDQLLQNMVPPSPTGGHQ